MIVARRQRDALNAGRRSGEPDNQPLEWTDPAERSLKFGSVVIAGPAIQRRSVIPRMWFTQWIRGMCYSGYDRRGNTKDLLSRPVDPTQCDIKGVPADVRDEALSLLCHAFDIPEKQKHCLRADDALIDIYRSFVGPRSWDELQFERLGLSLGKLPAGKVDPKEFHEQVQTVADLIWFTAARRGITRTMTADRHGVNHRSRMNGRGRPGGC